MPEEALDLKGGDAIFVASTGGHLTELYRLSKMMNAGTKSSWITFDSPQSRSVLTDSHVRFVPYVPPRGYRALLRTLRPVLSETRRVRPVAMISSGAALALSGLLAARLLGIPGHFIESITRPSGPSATGRAVAALHLASLWTQHATAANDRWRLHRSVLNSFTTVQTSPRDHRRPPRLFVTLGTISPYRFDALVDAVVGTGLADDRTVWQLGCTHRSDLPGESVGLMTPEDFKRTATAADVVITHAGAGTVLDLLDLGRSPVVVPRRAHRKEHVDDHQVEIARLLGDRQIAICAEAHQLTREMIAAAASTSVLTVPHA